MDKNYALVFDDVIIKQLKKAAKNQHVKNHPSETGGMMNLAKYSKWFLTLGIPPIMTGGIPLYQKFLGFSGFKPLKCLYEFRQI